jgi:hypothetical protein
MTFGSRYIQGILETLGLIPSQPLLYNINLTTALSSLTKFYKLGQGVLHIL